MASRVWHNLRGTTRQPDGEKGASSPAATLCRIRTKHLSSDPCNPTMAPLQWSTVEFLLCLKALPTARAVLGWQKCVLSHPDSWCEDAWLVQRLWAAWEGSTCCTLTGKCQWKWQRQILDYISLAPGHQGSLQSGVFQGYVNALPLINPVVQMLPCCQRADRTCI